MSPTSNDNLINNEMDSSVMNGHDSSNNDHDANRVMLAATILNRAKSFDDNKEYYEAVYFYRQGLDILLDELFVVQGTAESRNYLQNKCTHFMDRIDELKAIIYKDEPLNEFDLSNAFNQLSSSDDNEYLVESNNVLQEIIGYLCR